MVRSNAELLAEIQRLEVLLRVEESKLQDVGNDAKPLRSFSDAIDEAEKLRKENKCFRKRLDKLLRDEKVLGYDPQVVEKRNAAAAVWKEVESVKEEVCTLEYVRHQWIKGLKEDRANERSISAIRGQQYEEQIALRDELRDLTEKLREAEKLDDQLHKRFAVLQTQQLLNVQEEEVLKLKKKYAEQVKTIKELKESVDTLKTRRIDLMDEQRRLGFKEGRAKAKMERDIAELQTLLLRSEEELGQIYRAKGRLRSK